jgi:hypothetical protein
MSGSLQIACGSTDKTIHCADRSAQAAYSETSLNSKRVPFGEFERAGGDVKRVPQVVRHDGDEPLGVTAAQKVSQLHRRQLLGNVARDVDGGPISLQESPVLVEQEKQIVENLEQRRVIQRAHELLAPLSVDKVLAVCITTLLRCASGRPKIVYEI